MTISKECAEYLYRAIVNEMDGNFEEFERLSYMAMKHNNEMTCKTCDGIRVPCKYFYSKNHYVKGYICTDCGQVTDRKGNIVRRGMNRCLHQA